VRGSVSDSSAGTDAAQARPQRGSNSVRERALRIFLRPHLIAVLVLVVLGAISIVAWLGLRGVVHNQERRLLNERASELATYLQSTLSQTGSQLAAAGQAVAAGGPNSAVFASIATPLTLNGARVDVTQRSAGSFHTVASVGGTGSALNTTQERLATRAEHAGGLVYAIYAVNGVNHVTEAVAAPSAGTPTIALFDTVLPKPRPVPTTTDSPYRELDVALYGSTTADPKRIVLISGAIPKASSNPVHKVIAIGADKVLIVTAGHAALVGAVAQSMPWIVLVAGLVLAVLVAVLVELLSRRRAYALNLVEQRTRAMYQAQVAAEAANRSKSEFLSRMSHELRTPLNAVLGFSQLLELDELTPDQDQAVGQISKGGRHLLDLINEILDISQIETGTLTLSPEAVRAEDIIGESVDLIRPLADGRGIHLLDTGTQECAEYIFADRQRLKQILLNLLGNGIKYNRDGGTVSISCARPRPGQLRIQVTDTGPGIPAEQFGLLFTPFERLGAERTTVEGTGIGLALSRRLAEVMSGTLDVESTVGRGSTFWVELPIVEGPVERVERLEQLHGAPTMGPMTEVQPAVVHIEDNLSNVQLIERVLAQRPGVRLIPAMQGRLGVELARQHQPALVLLDLNLADLSGEDVLRMLRDDEATSRIPVAIVSADAMPRQVQRLLASGATAYLTKPIDVRELLALVDTALDAYRRRTDPAATTAEPAS
jgi:signal transduction histidine kinase/ActR/RegA family two-component response regulator